MTQQLSADEILKKVETDHGNERAQFSPDNELVPIPPIIEKDYSVRRFIENKPLKPEFLFEDILRKKIVAGLFAAGGAGKSFLLLMWSICLATGRNFGPFSPTGKNKILYIGAEDPEEELHRRVYSIAEKWNLLSSKDLSNNLIVYSAVGKIGPLLGLDGKGNPTTTINYEWLQKSIKNIKGLDLLVLDPLSRLYGLNENDNAHGTAWIHYLEQLKGDFNLNGVIFSHHEPKAATTTKRLKDSTGRGASSIQFGCRCTISMREMTEPDGEKFEVNPRDYIELDISKTNYSASLPCSIYFKRGSEGILESTHLTQEKIKSIAEILLEELQQLTEQELISRADLQFKKDGLGKDIPKKLKKEIPSFNHKRDMSAVINYALKEGWIYEEPLNSDGKKGPAKKVLKVKFNRLIG